MKVIAYAARTAGGALQPYEYESGPLGPNEVDVRVTHGGICHTDLAAVDEAALPIGQRVGVGALAGSCFRCESCISGRTNLCPRRDALVLRGDRGGFAHHVRASDWRHVYPIPDSMPSEHAAPLMCAGTTVFSPLIANRVLPTHRVAVVGIGGLGHLALQFLNKWGCEVTAISTTEDKQADAERFGATGFIASREPGALRAAAGSFDFVLSTVSGDLPWDDYLGILSPQGRLCVAGVPERPISVSALGLVSEAKEIVGGIVGTVAETRQMLGFAARHAIRPEVEMFALTDFEQALDRVRKGNVRYRAVVDFT